MLSKAGDSLPFVLSLYYWMLESHFAIKTHDLKPFIFSFQSNESANKLKTFSKSVKVVQSSFQKLLRVLVQNTFSPAYSSFSTCTHRSKLLVKNVFAHRQCFPYICPIPPVIWRHNDCWLSYCWLEQQRRVIQCAERKLLIISVSFVPQVTANTGNYDPLFYEKHSSEYLDEDFKLVFIKFCSK